MKNLSIPVSDGCFEKFIAIQKSHGFENQSNCLEYIIDEFVKLEGTRR